MKTDAPPMSNNGMRLPSVAEPAMQTLLRDHCPAAVVVNTDLEVIYFHGETGRFLEIPQGRPSTNLLKLLKTGLGPGTRELILSCLREQQAQSKLITMLEAKQTHAVRMHCQPLQTQTLPSNNELSDSQSLVLLTFKITESTHSDGQLNQLLAAQQPHEDQLSAAQADISRLNWTLDTVMSANEDLIMLCDGDARFTMVNIHAAAYFNRSQQSLLGASWDDLALPAELLEMLNRAWQIMRHSNESQQISTSLRLAETQKAQHLNFYLKPLSGNHTEFSGALLRIRDNTASHKTQQRLKDIESRLHSLTDSVPVLIGFVDPNLRYQFVNLEYERWFGVPRAQLLGNTINRWLGSAFADTKDAMQQALLGKPQNFESQVEHYRLGSRLVRGSYTPNFGRDGEVSGFYMVVSDITELKQSQSAAMQQQAELEHFGRIALIGEMTSGFAHEINQPLAAIKTYATGAKRLLSSEPTETQSLNKRKLQSQLQEALTEIDQQAERAAGMIQNLRDFVRKDPADKRQTDTKSIIDAAFSLAEIQARPYRVELQRFDSETIKINANAQEIQQVLVNLLLNAMEATLKNNQQRLVTLHCHLELDMVHFDVNDNGHGIAPEHAEQIFDAFFSTKGFGMGMGLSVSASIAEKHLGKLSIKESNSRGSCIRLSLPAN